MTQSTASSMLDFMFVEFIGQVRKPDLKIMVRGTGKLVSGYVTWA